MNEEWRDVVGYEGRYQVSSMGRVKSLERKDRLGRTVKERILKPIADRCGYQVVNLHNGGKQKKFSVHRLVCEAFCENPENKSEVNHINEDKTDNRASNLEWCTRRENVNHGTRNKRSGETQSKPVGQYTRSGELVKLWPSTIEAERQTGFGQSHISAVANGNRKTAYGFIWKYV